MPAIDLSRVPQSAFLFQHLPPDHPAHSRFIDMRQAVNVPAPALANLFAAPPTIQPTKMTPSIKPENPMLADAKARAVKFNKGAEATTNMAKPSTGFNPMLKDAQARAQRFAKTTGV